MNESRGNVTKKELGQRPNNNRQIHCSEFVKCSALFYLLLSN